jgi:hypothetical protein
MPHEQDDDEPYDPYTEEMAERDYPADFGEAFELDTDFIMPRTVETVENEIAAMLLFGRERVGEASRQELVGLSRAGEILGYDLVSDENGTFWFQPKGIAEKIAARKAERDTLAAEQQASEMRVIGRAIEETTRDDMRRAS